MIHHLLLGTRRKSHGQNSGSLEKFQKSSRDAVPRGGGLGSRPKKMYGERLGDEVEYHLMSPTPRR